MTLVSPTSPPTLVLRNHAKGILQAIALDIGTIQNPEQQYQKSRGNAPLLLNATPTASAWVGLYLSIGVQVVVPRLSERRHDEMPGRQREAGSEPLR